MPVERDHTEYHLLLSLEASGDAVSVALINYGGCVAFKQHNARFGHAEYLVNMVQGLMEEADASFSAGNFLIAPSALFPIRLGYLDLSGVAVEVKKNYCRAILRAVGLVRQNDRKIL